jgi:uncharacterized protein
VTGVGRCLVVASLLLGLACGGPSGGQAGPVEAVVSFQGTDGSLRVEIADSVEEQRKGLAGRTELQNDRGMAFVYDDPVEHHYWMKDTLLPLSIAFVDERGRIVTILDMVPCEDDTCPLYGSDGPYVLALEANRGWFADHGIGEGHHVEIRQT